VYAPYGSVAIYGLASRPQDFVGELSDRGGIDTKDLPDAYRFFCTACKIEVSMLVRDTRCVLILLHPVL